MDREKWLTEDYSALGKSAAGIIAAALEELGRKMIRQKALDECTRQEADRLLRPRL